MTSTQHAQKSAEFLYVVCNGSPHLAIRGMNGEIYHPSKDYKLIGSSVNPLKNNQLLILPYITDLIRATEAFAKENKLEELFKLSMGNLKRNIRSARFTIH